MAYEPRMGLTQGLRQSLVITPQLKQAIKILQLAQIDLALLVTEEVEQNPTLEVLDDGQEEVDVESLSMTPDERMPELEDPTAADAAPAVVEETAAELAPENSTLSDIKDNVHWFQATSDASFIFNIHVMSVVPGRTGRVYIDPDGEKLSGGRIKARKIDHAEANKLYG